ncbi:phasin family protein [Phytohabitans kaempferiae]|uniref:Phasin family protein n=1 Tax=Phytohabitans kaempferiae TaxID=1620943 RepID=A0ABV6M6Y1_9ACTN
MQEAWKAYLELALGLTEASRKKAQKVAKKLVGKGGVTAAQLQALAEDLVSTSLANREALSKIVRFEVDRTLGKVGLATAEEVADLTARVRDLEEELRQARAGAAPVAESAPVAEGAPVADAPTPTGVVAKKTVAKKAVAKKAAPAPAKTVAKKAVAKKAVAKKAVAKKTVAKKVTPAEPAPEESPAAPARSAAAKAPAKKTAAPRKTVAKKATPAAGEA